MGMFYYYDFPNAEILVFDDFLVVQIREGADIHPKHNEKLNEIVETHYSGKHFVYISNRVNSYSVDPLTYVETEKITNLIGIAIVTDARIMRKNAEYEKNFFDKPYKIFNTLSEAIQWAHKILTDFQQKQ
ncbi:STAS/SEC14 domain-containing protein [Mangrovimonas sp. TPBH4]|uniref:STAS/SEC14 domain-containing protein n=1 Tax=Mangrovimonas sp. TPBH4 TaxID=1645914 RepID=UPI0006B5FF16|nr:STAS/SEC14 domain-containing protein [Mangrovimonas sp. TPBH4]